MLQLLQLCSDSHDHALASLMSPEFDVSSHPSSHPAILPDGPCHSAMTVSLQSCTWQVTLPSFRNAG